MNIGKASKLSMLTVKAVRYYDNIDLVKPHQNISSGYREYNDEDVLKLIIDYDIKLLVLAGYMRLLSQNFVNSLPSKFIVNVHPSLLPKYKGMNAIKQAIDDCAEYTGVTIHYVDEGMDSGSIIKQDSIKINEFDTVETLKDRLQTIEHRLYSDTIKSILIKN